MAHSPSERWENGVLVERNLSTWDTHVRGDINDDESSFRDEAEKPAKRVAKKAAKK